MKQKDVGNNSKETTNSFRPFRSAETETQEQPKQKVSHESVSKKDLFLMSFLGFITGGILILGLLFFTGAITGNVILDLSGEKEVVTEELVTPVVETPVENSTETTNVTQEVVVEEPVVEEVVEVEEEVVEVSDPCGPENEITLALDETYSHNGRDVILKLAGDFAAQISIGGKKELISVGETMDINGESITMTDGSEADQTVTISIAC